MFRNDSLVVSATAIGIVAAAGVADVTPQWTTVYRDGANAYSPRGSDVDTAGNSYVAASVGQLVRSDIALTKFDANGEFVWEQIFNGPISGQDLAIDAVLDADETAIYLVGRSQTDASSDYLVVKYGAATGAEIWTRFFDGPASTVDDPRAAAATPDGGIVVTGKLRNDDGYDYGTVKYTADGGVAWSKLYADGGRFLFEDDSAEVIVVTPEGDVVISGHTEPTSGGADVVTIRYDGATGDQEWLARYSTSANENVRDIALAPNGDVVVFGSDPFGIDRQWLTVRYDGATGAELWTVLDDVGFDEGPSSVFVGDDGTVYVTGSTDPDGDDDNFNENLIVIAYEGDTGARRWLDEFGDLGFNDAEGGSDLRISAAGTLVVIGNSYSESVTGDDFGADAIIREYDPANGDLLDMVVIDVDDDRPSYDFFTELHVDGDGEFYARGFTDGDITPPPGLLLTKFTLGGVCRVDLDGDGVLTLFDFLAFQNLFDAGDPAADFDGDGSLTIFDFLAFQNEFDAGCD